MMYVDRASAWFKSNNFSGSPTLGAAFQRVFFSATTLFFFFGTAPLFAQVTQEEVEFFEKRIRPVLVERCQLCHGPQSEPMAGLRVDTPARLQKGGSRGTAIIPGDPDASLLIKAIRYSDVDLKMPPDGKLPAEQIRDLESWVRMGAPDPRTEEAEPAASEKGIDIEEGRQFWSFRPLATITPAAAEVSAGRADWPTSAIDPFVLTKLEAAGLEPAPPADKRTLLRRVTFDLVGLPPSRQEIDDFLADNSPQAFARVVDRLLDSPHYGERWARHWLDLVRFAETNGHEFDNDKLDAWRYRDYVIRAFNDDVSYDRFVKEHIAGDLLPSHRLRADGAQRESPLGTGFYWFGEVLNSATDSVKAKADTVDNQIDVLSKAFLGLTVSCARCHDHKFDPIPTADYYSLAGILHSTAIREAAVDSPERGDEIEGINGQIGDTNREIQLLLSGAAALPAAEWKRYLVAAVELLSTDESDVACRLEELAHEQELDRVALKAWLAYLQQTANEPDHVLYPLARLAKAPAPDEPSAFAQRLGIVRKKLDGLSQQASPDHPAHKERGDTVYEDFDRPSYEGWVTEGQAFGAGPSNNIPPNQAIAGFAAETMATSFGRGSDKLLGSLTTAKFQMPKLYVHVRMAGTPDRTRFPEFAKIRLTIDADGHKSQHFTSQANGVWQWVTRRMTKEIGRICYIEIVDRSRDGHIAIDKIVFSDSPEPPGLAPDEHVIELLAKTEIDSMSALAEGYGKLYERARSAKAADRDSRRLTAALSPPGSLETAVTPFLSAQEKDRLATLRHRRRMLESRIPDSAFGMVSTDENPRNVAIHVRGNHKNLGREVPRQFLQVIAGENQAPYNDGSGRLQLAEAMVSPDNPLAARVMVNRIWKHHFGSGIVRSTDNFGQTGERPTHSELLDFLARRFIESGWSVKEMHRMMVLSNTYRMASRVDEKAARVDPENKLLHHMPVRRLEAETIRDAVLAAAGSLDPTVGGPSVLPHISKYQDGRGKPQSGPLDGHGRRSIYIQVRRNFLTPMFLAFDYPSPISAIGRRGASTVPSQALIMMNNAFVNGQTQAWARSVIARHEREPERVEDMFIRAFGRLPQEAEVEQARAFLREQETLYAGAHRDDPRVWADLAHVLLNSTEFIFVR